MALLLHPTVPTVPSFHGRRLTTETDSEQRLLLWCRLLACRRDILLYIIPLSCSQTCDLAAVQREVPGHPRASCTTLHLHTVHFVMSRLRPLDAERVTA